LAAGALLTQVYADADLTSSGIVFTNLGTSAVSASTTGLSGVLSGATLAVERVTGDTLRLPTLQALQEKVIPAGQTRIWSVSYATGTSIEEKGALHEDGFELMPAYPNPFNPSTQIGFTVETQDLASPHVRLAIFDILGREVAVLVDGAMPAGSHSVTFDASGLASGVYLVRLEADGMVRTRSISLIK